MLSSAVDTQGTTAPHSEQGGFVLYISALSLPGCMDIWASQSFQPGNF